MSSEYLQNIRYRDTDLIKIATQKWLTLEQHEYGKNFCKLQFNKKPIKKKYDRLKESFLREWQTLELDLHKYWCELDFLLTGSLDSHRASTDRILPLISINHNWDNFPLVDAILNGKNIGYETGYGQVRYLLPNEVEIVLLGLLELSEDGFKDRYQREAGKTNNILQYIDWQSPETEEWFVEWYLELTNYYHDAAKQNHGMLFYFF